MKLQFKHQKFKAVAAKAIYGSSFEYNPAKINAEEVFKLLATNTSVKVI